MLKDSDTGVVHYTTVRNIETGELVRAWPFSDILEADQKRRDECRKGLGDVPTIAWIESLDPRVESYPPIFKIVDPDKEKIIPLSERSEF